jgi:uncharacterized LabA/DUF88 family protein
MKTTLFFDVANLEATFRQYGGVPDYLGLRDLLNGNRELVEAYVYVPVSPFKPDGRKPLIDFLQRHGFFVRPKLGRARANGHFKCDQDVDIVCDLLRAAWHRTTDVAVVACGDGDFRPAYRIVREQGIRIEVAAVREATPDDILESASAFVDLSEAIQEQLSEENHAADNGNGRVVMPMAAR